MADEVDRADELAEELLKRTIAYTVSRPPEVEPNGKCYNCGAKVKRSMRWCDADCREDWAKRTKK